MNDQPPAVCPLHRLPVKRRGDRDGQESHKCPAPECSFEFLRPVRLPESAEPPGQDPHFDHAYSTDPEI
jgi:hypothetical protein